jgi:hypothetical protein
MKKTNKNMVLIGSILLFTFAQSLAWYQNNGQFVYPWFKEHKFLLSLLGVPISYLFITATGMSYEALGKAWPGRLLTFATGITVYTILTFMLMNEVPTWKSILSLILTAIIVILQVI